MPKYLRLAITLAFVANIAAGCASQTTTTTRETVYSENDSYRGEPVTVERRTTTTETTNDDSHGGVLSSTVNTVGEVVAFPFRVVGGAIRALF
jgi:hypothetical protein